MQSIQDILRKTRADINARRIKAEAISTGRLAESKERLDSKLVDDLARIEEQRKRCLALLGK